MLHPLDRIARSTKRLKRRQLAIILVLVAAPAVAEEAGSGAVRMLPPLPLQDVERTATSHLKRLKGHAQDETPAGVRLATGQGSALGVRLKPVSNVVGLRDVQATPTDGETQTPMKIERVQPPGVRINPLAYPDASTDSASKPGPVTTQLPAFTAGEITPPVQRNDFATAATAREEQAASQVRAKTESHRTTRVQSATAIRLSDDPSAASAATSAKSAIRTDLTDSRNDSAAASTRAVPQAIESTEPKSGEKPIFYSFSDLSYSADSDSTDSTTAKPRKPAGKQAPVEAAELTPKTEREVATKTKATRASTVSRFQPASRAPITVPPLGVQEVRPPQFEKADSGRSVDATTATPASAQDVPAAERQNRLQAPSGIVARKAAADHAEQPKFAPTVIEPARHPAPRDRQSSVLQAAEPIDLSDDPHDDVDQTDVVDQLPAAPTPDASAAPFGIKNISVAKAVASPITSKSVSPTPSKPVVARTTGDRPAAGVELAKPFQFDESEAAGTQNVEETVTGETDAEEAVPPVPAATLSQLPDPDSQNQAQPLPRKSTGPRASAEPRASTAPRATAEPRATAAQQNPAKTLQRYRPPVEVKQVPVVVGRQPNKKEYQPAVQPVHALSIDSDRTIEIPNGQQLIPLRMTKAEVRTLKVGGEIIDVQLGDAGICQVLKAAPNELKLIGTDHGVTRLLVRARSGDNPEYQTGVFEIRIGAAVGDTVDQTQQHARLLNHSISEAFPQCRVVVTAYPDKLTVTGVCDGETSAKQIMRMVRKTCLVPVEDLLTIR